MAEIFSEIYNCYFQVVKSLLQTTLPFTKAQLSTQINKLGFEESAIYLLPKLFDEKWGFFTEKNGTVTSRLSPDFFVPLSNLQKSYLKTILLDEKIRLFLSDEKLADIAKKSTMKWEKSTQKGQFGNVTVRKSGDFVIRSTGSVFFIYKNGKQIGMTNKLRDATAFVELYNKRGENNG